MNRTNRTTTIDTRHTDEAPRGDCIKLQTTLYDLIRAMQDDVGPDEDTLIVDAVMQWIRSGRIQSLGQPLRSFRMTPREAFPVSA